MCALDGSNPAYELVQRVTSDFGEEPRKISRDLYPPLPDPHMLLSFEVAATAMTVRVVPALTHDERLLMKTQAAAPDLAQAIVQCLGESLWAAEPDLGRACAVAAGCKRFGVELLPLP